jgi:trehalose/maltose transport system substrate-binding protein
MEDVFMTRRIAAVAASVLVFSLILPTAIGVSARSGHGQTAIRFASGIPAAPADPWAKQDKKYKGQTLTFFGGSVGTDALTDAQLAKSFTKSTGIHIHLVPAPASSSDTLAKLQQVFSAGSSSIDATRLDVVWPGTLGRYLVDISKPLAADAKLEVPSLLKNDTVGGHLIAMPYQGDFGMLFYRKDLMKKYHISKPPTTWSALTADAKKIQAGEKKTNKNFWGFVFQGNSYEGLTCNAAEWIASYGGGSFINAKGKVTVDNKNAAAALKLAQSWVGKISPKGVTTYQESDTHGAFLAGNVAFARNWPYMDSPTLINGTKVQGKVGVAPLPHGPGGTSSATTGGWQVAVSKYSKHKGASEAWARYYASFAVQVWRATYGGIVPTMPSVAKVKSVLKAQPFLGPVGNHTQRVVRPSTILGGNYPKGSTFIFQAINSILNGSNVSSELKTLQTELQSLHP